MCVCVCVCVCVKREAEIREQFRLAMEDMEPAQRWSNGVERKVIQLGDQFHCDNLTVNAFSNGAFGHYDRENFRAIHHRRAQQLWFDIVNFSRTKATELMDKIMGNRTFPLQAVKERQQRWEANQEQMAWILEKLGVLDSEGVPSLVSFCREMFEISDTSWVRRSADDLATMLSMPEIMVAFAAEADMGEYFKICTRFNKVGHVTARYKI